MLAGLAHAIVWSAGFAALGAGLSRTELATYLPAFMVAGLLCIVAAAWFGGAGPGFLSALLATFALPQLIPMNYPLVAGFFDLPRFLAELEEPAPSLSD